MIWKTLESEMRISLHSDKNRKFQPDVFTHSLQIANRFSTTSILGINMDTIS